jgi:hypothetical protein
VSTTIPLYVPLNGYNEYTLCSGQLLDNGLSSNYSNNSNGYCIIHPNSSTAHISLNGNYNLENNYDYIRIYDGVGTGGTLLGTYTSNGTLSFEHSTPNSPITVQFTSDGSVVYSGFNLTIGCVEYLPIELYSFIANCDNNNINIKWSTMSETNNDYFVLWKSYDGVDFEIIGQIDGAGNSNSYLEYEFSYQDIIENIYYKLQQIDYDGNNTYSDVISVNCEQNIGYTIVPNPSIDGNFHVYGVDSDDEISVFDVIGKRCNNEILESGCYTVFVNKEFIGKLIVK